MTTLLKHNCKRLRDCHNWMDGCNSIDAERSIERGLEFRDEDADKTAEELAAEVTAELDATKRRRVPR